ncbi:MAG TPA: dihydroorotase [Chitinophagaceae bacterium]|nr:dihydroorotase [Chitinophagaceae bacterium]
MKILIKQARIIDPSSPHNGQIADIFIENGLISQISGQLNPDADQVVSLEGLCVSPGWVDVFASFADPGFEYKETLETGANAAAAGGYTDVLIIPNTNPVLHNKAAVEYVVHKGQHLPVTIHPIGAITRNTEGKELAEMYDMKWSGAVAFSDGVNCVQSAGLLVKALQYVKAFDGIIIQVPDDKSVNPPGLINEGVVSTQLGLPGKPAMAEELVVERDINLAEYTDSKIHLTGISTRKSAGYVQKGKENGIAVSCSVTPYHLFFTDEDMTSYNTHLKVNPPIRTAEDRAALRDAVLNGTVDCLASHHLPHEIDSKVIEFEYAKFGMTGLQTAYAVLNTAVAGISTERCVELLAVNPRSIFSLEPASITEGQKAKITLFQPATTWTFTPDMIRSKSANTPFIGQTFTGKVTGIINGDRITLS